MLTTQRLDVSPYFQKSNKKEIIKTILLKILNTTITVTQVYSYFTHFLLNLKSAKNLPIRKKKKKSFRNILEVKILHFNRKIRKRKMIFLYLIQPSIAVKYSMHENLKPLYGLAYLIGSSSRICCRLGWVFFQCLKEKQPETMINTFELQHLFSAYFSCKQVVFMKHE